MDLHPALAGGQFIVLYGSEAIITRAHHLVATLLRLQDVNLLDAGGRLRPYLLIHLIRQHTTQVDVWLKRLHLQRAFTAHQVAAALETLPLTSIPLVVLDFLATFYDDTLPLPQGRVLLQRCLTQCERLRQGAPLLMTLSRPPQSTCRPLLSAVLQHATAFFHEPGPTPLPTQLSLW